MKLIIYVLSLVVMLLIRFEFNSKKDNRADMKLTCYDLCL